MADDTAQWASSGVVALTGHADGPPLVPPGDAAAVALRLARRLPFPVDGPALLAERAAFTGVTRRGTRSAGGHARLLPTADGWAAVSCARPDDPALFGALVESPIEGDPWPAITAWLAGHTGADLADRATLLGLAATPVAPAPAVDLGAAPGRRVDGALVVDFSALWAGPLCARLLGLAGARVVKVETPSRPDGARLADAGFYRLLHAGHRSVVLDPATRDGRAAMAGLVAAADFVVEASRPRALAGFGLDARACAAAGTTWVSITAAGRASDRVGFGDDVAAGAGLVARDAAGTPLFCGDALADPLTGLAAAVLALSAPPGTLLDVPMAGVVAATLPPGPVGPAPAAEWAGGRWVVGGHEVRAPRHGEVTGTAPASGADTAEVLREVGLS
ncbi:CoA transferase [Actinophytocola xinjiangensis]|uniref:CoA transferase n=1 Tax=Actinophytocola xinjiangensis TaxID=485602 RepID=UPI000A7B6D90|nr:CoA transferase [Actinophytocola xinjiangensis]